MFQACVLLVVAQVNEAYNLATAFRLKFQTQVLAVTCGVRNKEVSRSRERSTAFASAEVLLQARAVMQDYDMLSMKRVPRVAGYSGMQIWIQVYVRVAPFAVPAAGQ